MVCFEDEYEMKKKNFLKFYSRDKINFNSL